jgi:hypothetical protein
VRQPDANNLFAGCKTLGPALCELSHSRPEEIAQAGAEATEVATMFFDRGDCACGAGIGMGAALAAGFAFVGGILLAVVGTVAGLVVAVMVVRAACYAIACVWVGIGYGVYLLLGGDEWLEYRRDIVARLPWWKRTVYLLVRNVLGYTAAYVGIVGSIVVVCDALALVLPG